MALGVVGSKPVSKFMLYVGKILYSVPLLFLDILLGGPLGRRRGLDLILIGDDGGVGVASDNPGVIHEVGGIEAILLSLPVLGLESRDFGLG